MNKTVVWDLFNKFRGYVDPNTLSDLTAYTLLLKHGEMLSYVYYQEKYSTKYLSRVYGDLILENDLYKYVEEIEKFYNIPSGLIAQPFTNTIHKFESGKENHILLDYFRYLSEIEFEDPEEIAEAFDYYLELLGSRMGKATSEYVTNRYLAKLEAELLDVKENQRIYDPFCGAGMTIVASGCKNNTLYARDVNSNTVAIAAINMILHGHMNINVNCGDSLFTEYDQFDRVVSEPPLNAKYPDFIYENFKYRKETVVSRDAIEIEVIINNLNETGKAVILVPAGFLFRGGKTQEYRSFLVKNNLIEAIVGLPSGVIPGTGVNTALLVINKNKDNNDVIMLDSSSLWEKENVRDYFLTDENIKKISKIVLKTEEVAGVSKIVGIDAITENNFNMTPTMFVTPFSSEEIEVKDIKGLISLQKELEIELSVVSKELLEIRG